MSGVRLPSVKLWEACAMSLDLSPNSLSFDRDAWMSGPSDGSPMIKSDSFPDESTEKSFHQRLRTLRANLSDRKWFTPDVLSLTQPYLHHVTGPRMLANPPSELRWQEYRMADGLR